MKLDPTPLGFRPMTAADIPLAFQWLNRDFVKQWYYSHDYSYAAIEREQLEHINGEIPSRSYIITYADKPIGYIQAYRIHDWPEYAEVVAEAENAAAIDLYIGEADYLHRGLGGPLIRKFMREVLFPSLPDTVSCIIGPDERNEVAKRAYANAGFKYLKTIVVPDDPGPEYLMRISREDALRQ